MTPDTLPESWQSRMFEEIAARTSNAIVDGPFGSNLKLTDYVEAGIPVLQGKNITNDKFVWSDIRYISPKKAEQLKRSAVRLGDILIVKIGSIGYSAILDDLNGHGFAIIPANLIKFSIDSDVALTEYVHQYLTSQMGKRSLIAAASSTAQPALSLKSVKHLFLPIPPLPEQKKIAAILGSVDGAIAATQAVIDQTRKVKQGLLQQLLTRGIGHTRFKKTEIGEIPEEWEVARLATVICDKPKNGRSPKASTSPPGVPTFSIAAVRRGSVNIAEHLKFADVPTVAVERFKLKRDDILIVRGNANPDLIGTCGIVRSFPKGCIYPDILMRVRVNHLMLPPFLVEVWNSEVVRQQVLDRAKTTVGTYKVNQADISSILLSLPSVEEQQKILDVLKSVAINEELLDKEYNRLTKVKAGLMQDLLTGRVRVKGVA